jgi:integrase
VFAHTGVRTGALTIWRDAQVDPLTCEREPGLEHGHITLHEARPTFCSLMLRHGIDPVTVAKYAGHSSAAFTMDRYAKYIPGPGAAGRDRVDAALEVAA